MYVVELGYLFVAGIDRFIWQITIIFRFSK